jgi:hypothetical protein
LQKLRWHTILTAIKSTNLKTFIAKTDNDYSFEEGTIETMHPLALQARANAEDNPTWEEAMTGPNKDSYWQAMETELEMLEIKKDSWEVVDQQRCVCLKIKNSILYLWRLSERGKIPLPHWCCGSTPYASSFNNFELGN